jgi:hypothetical protein
MDGIIDLSAVASDAIITAASYAVLSGVTGTSDGQWAYTSDDGAAYRWAATVQVWVPSQHWRAAIPYLTGNGGAAVRVLLADAAVPTWGTPSGSVTKSAGNPLTLGSTSYLEGTPSSEGAELDEVLILIELGGAPTGHARAYLYQPNGGGSNSGLSVRINGTGAPALDAYTSGLIGSGSTQGSLAAGSWLIAYASWRSADDAFTLWQPGAGAPQRGALATRSEARTLGAQYAGLMVDGVGEMSVRQYHVLNLGGA